MKKASRPAGSTKVSDATITLQGARETIERSYRLHIAQYLGDLEKEIAALDPRQEKVLALAISSLTKISEIDQNDVALCLGQSRLQIGRWSREEHIPRNAEYRSFLGMKLLDFVRLKASEFAAKPTPSAEPHRGSTRSSSKVREPAP